LQIELKLSKKWKAQFKVVRIERSQVRINLPKIFRKEKAPEEFEYDYIHGGVWDHRSYGIMMRAWRDESFKGLVRIKAQSLERYIKGQEDVVPIGFVFVEVLAKSHEDAGIFWNKFSELDEKFP
jgi:hypothetical protein